MNPQHSLWERKLLRGRCEGREHGEPLQYVDGIKLHPVTICRKTQILEGRASRELHDLGLLCQCHREDDDPDPAAIPPRLRIRHREYEMTSRRTGCSHTADLGPILLREVRNHSNANLTEFRSAGVGLSLVESCRNTARPIEPHKQLTLKNKLPRIFEMLPMSKRSATDINRQTLLMRESRRPCMNSTEHSTLARRHCN